MCDFTCVALLHFISFPKDVYGTKRTHNLQRTTCQDIKDPQTPLVNFSTS